MYYLPRAPVLWREHLIGRDAYHTQIMHLPIEGGYIKPTTLIQIYKIALFFANSPIALYYIGGLHL